MCTVAFVPLPAGGYRLGHNRDERRARSRGLPPRRHTRAGVTFLAPSDPDGGGTWIGVNDSGLTMCLLNASEPRPGRLPPEPPSRGAVLRELLHLEGAGEVEARLEEQRSKLANVRAFHLVVAEPAAPGRPSRSVRFRWDGESLERDDHEGPRLYVSSSLDPTGAERERCHSWHDLLRSHPEPDGATLRAWLCSHEPERGPLSVCMHRPEARTVSRTLVTVAGGEIEMAYLDGSPCTPDGPEITLRL